MLIQLAHVFCHVFCRRDGLGDLIEIINHSKRLEANHLRYLQMQVVGTRAFLWRNKIISQLDRISDLEAEDRYKRIRYEIKTMLDYFESEKGLEYSFSEPEVARMSLLDLECLFLLHKIYDQLFDEVVIYEKAKIDTIRDIVSELDTRNLLYGLKNPSQLKTISRNIYKIIRKRLHTVYEGFNTFNQMYEKIDMSVEKIQEYQNAGFIVDGRGGMPSRRLYGKLLVTRKYLWRKKIEILMIWSKIITLEEQKFLSIARIIKKSFFSEMFSIFVDGMKQVFALYSHNPNIENK